MWFPLNYQLNRGFPEINVERLLEALIMVPADGNFTTAIAKGNHKAGEIQGQTRQHSRLINLLGVKQTLDCRQPSAT